MRAEIRSLQRRLGLTMIFVTHDQTEAMSMADRVALMRDGRIEHFDGPEVLYARPASAFAARFIGAPPMNVVPVADLGVAVGHLPQGLLAGLRPEDIALTERGLPGRVLQVEYLGADSILSVDIGGPRLAVRLQGRPGIAAGQPVQLGWGAEALHLFDADTGLLRDAGAARLSRTNLQPD